MRSGMEIELYVPLKTMPKRIHQKIRTLQKYVEKHPKSWEKKDWNWRICFIYQVSWPEAVVCYGKVLEDQPALFRVWLQLGEILHLMGEEDDAIEVIKRALDLSRNKASRDYVSRTD